MRNLTEGKPFRTILLFALPLMISGILAQTYNMVDLLIAGKFLGEDGLSSVGATSTFIQFLSSYFWGIGVAVSAVIGNYFGAKNYEKVVRTGKNVLFFVSVTMIVVCLACFLLADPIFRMLNIKEDVYDLAMQYYKIYILSLFVQAVSYQFTSILHAIGDSKIPLVATTVSGVANIGLNLLFVGACRWGVLGLGFATLISSVVGGLVSGVAVFYYMTKKLGGNLKWDFTWKSLQPVAVLAGPCILQQCALYLSAVIVQPVVNGLGKTAIAGYSVAMSLSLFMSAAFHSYSRAVATYASQSLGSKKYENFRKGIWIGYAQQLMVLTPIVIVCFLFPREIISLFLKNNPEECVAYAINYIWVTLPFVVAYAYANLMHSFYKAVGAVKSVLFCTTLFTVSRILFTYLVPMGDYLVTVYWGLSFAWTVEAVALLTIYLTGIWKPLEMKKFSRNDNSKC